MPNKKKLKAKNKLYEKDIEIAHLITKITRYTENEKIFIDAIEQFSAAVDNLRIISSEVYESTKYLSPDIDDANISKQRDDILYEANIRK